MRIIDLTQPIRTGLPVYPGDPEVRVQPHCTLERDGYAVAALHLSDQAGTHVETQAHMLPGRTLDQEPLQRFIGGRAAVIDVPCGPIRPDLLESQHVVPELADFLLLRSGYADRTPAIDPADPHRPWLTPEAAHWIVDQRFFTLVGIDCFDLDHPPDYPTHHILLSAGLLIVEGLVNLHALGSLAQVFIVPIRLQGTGAAPCRAFAVQAE